MRLGVSLLDGSLPLGTVAPVPPLPPLRTLASGPIGVVGCGYLGSVHAACLAHWGFETIALDVDPWKLEQLRTGVAPFHEEMLNPLLEEGLKSNRLSFTTEFADLSACSVVFLCVGTPQRPDSPAADLSQVDTAIDSLVNVLQPGTLVVGKSTTPVGTAAALAEVLAAAGLHLAWNPEFLREGTAVADTLHPERIVVGTTLPDAAVLLKELYRLPVADGSTFLVTDLNTAEMVKTAANAFLATKVSFINAVSDLCDRTAADVEMVSLALGLDSRIGPKFLKSGIGYGGGCFPKDVRALQHHATELGAIPLADMLATVDAANLDARRRALAAVDQFITSSVYKVAVLGAAFKPGSDDLRDSPAVWLVENLLRKHPTVKFSWHDPALAGRMVCGIELSHSILQATTGADMLVVATDWAEYKSLNPNQLNVATKMLFDLRNCIPPEPWTKAGFTLHRLGRPTASPASS